MLLLLDTDLLLFGLVLLLANLLLLLDTDRPVAGEAYNIVGPDSLTWNDYFRSYNAALGLEPLRTKRAQESSLAASVMEPLRKAASLVLGAFREPIMRLYERSELANRLLVRTQRSLRTTPSLSELALYRRRATYVDDKLWSLLGHEPQIALSEGLAITVRWLVHHGYVRGEWYARSYD